jgi:hypothetical protein
MGLLSGMLGNASKVDPASLQKEYERLLVPGENIEQAYRLIRDLVVFTDQRLLLINIQGVTGKKTSYHSVPYRSISHFGIETAGHFDLDATLQLFLVGEDTPLAIDFSSNVDCFELQRMLAGHVLRQGQLP